MSQRTEVLAYLKKGKTITPLEALRLFGCFRLADVIYKLRNQGHVIDMELVQHGNGNQFAMYRLGS